MVFQLNLKYLHVRITKFLAGGSTITYNNFEISLVAYAKYRSLQIMLLSMLIHTLTSILAEKLSAKLRFFEIEFDNQYAKKF